MKKENRIRVYCAGGMGMDLGSQISNPLFDTCYLDVSDANYNTDEIHEERIHLVAGAKKGSGSDRSTNYGPIKQAVPAFIHEFPPTDFNIVLFSSSGGTGSMAGPLIVSALLEARVPFMVVTLTDASTTRWTKNAIQTLQTLEAQALRFGLPVVMNHHQNGDVPRGEVDREILYAIEAIGYLASGENHALDTQDVANFVQYTELTDVQAQLATVTIHDTRQTASTVIEPIATASLYTRREDYVAFGSPKYTTYGFPRSGDLFGGQQLHFVINHATLESIHGQLEERRVDLQRTHSGYKQRKAIVGTDDNVDNDGFVFD